ncbi:hypothetical protein ABIB45_004563 [Arthrobacter sp. UYCo732]
MCGRANFTWNVLTAKSACGFSTVTSRTRSWGKDFNASAVTPVETYRSGKSEAVLGEVLAATPGLRDRLGCRPSAGSGSTSAGLPRTMT